MRGKIDKTYSFEYGTPNTERNDEIWNWSFTLFNVTEMQYKGHWYYSSILRRKAQAAI